MKIKTDAIQVISNILKFFAYLLYLIAIITIIVIQNNSGFHYLGLVYYMIPLGFAFIGLIGHALAEIIICIGSAAVNLKSIQKKIDE